MTIQQLLKGRNSEFDASKRIKLVRHATTYEVFGKKYDGTVSDLYNDRELFLKYQRHQRTANFDGVDYIVSFISEKGTDSLFVGVFKNEGRKPDESGVISLEGESFYDINQIPGFEDLIEQVVIEWKNPRGWHQWYKHEMEVVAQRSTLPFNDILDNRFAQFHLNTDDRIRHVEESTMEVEARHQKIQVGIMSCLKSEGYTDIVAEEDHVDIRASKYGIPHFFEVKTFDTAKACIREALGQILEYNHYPSNKRASDMFIVGPYMATHEDINYLKYLRANYKIRVFYRCYNEKSKMLLPSI